jgi:pimeloyl-ACP methyl ester carboxylesterase/nucleotide-binding universal stress UspA family protein
MLATTNGRTASGSTIDANPEAQVLHRVVSDVGVTDRPSLGWQRRPGQGLAILNPLSFGVTNEGLSQAPGQSAFLDALAAGFDLVTYDQRGSGQSRDAGAALDWEQLGADLWRVADAAGIERAVLYGVADAGYTIAHAAALQPGRVLGMIFNAVTPKFAPDAEHPRPSPDRITRWLDDPSDGSVNDPAPMLEDFGVDASDARALAIAWRANSSTEAVQRRGALILRADIREILPDIKAPALVMQPPRREIVRGWGDATAALLPHRRIVEPARGIEAIGAIHAFLAVLTAGIGRKASLLSPELSDTVESSEQSVGQLRRIAVAVDDDLSSGRAVELACRLGAAQNAEIILIHVIEVPYTLPLDKPSADAVARSVRAIELGQAIVGRHRLRSPRPCIVTGRSVGASVVTAADDRDADLIVVSNSNRVPTESGSSPIVSEVLRRAPGKVLVNSGES